MKKVNNIDGNLWNLVFDLDAANTTENNTTTTTAATPTTASPPKMITIREPLEYHVELRDYADPTPEAQANSKKK
jgi:hypothetical protein